MRKTNTWGGKALVLLLAAVMALALMPVAAQASEISISDYGDLQNEAASTTSKHTIIELGNNITNGTAELSIGRNLTLDLNGYTLSIISNGNGINIENGVTLTIQNSGTGGELNTTGGGTGAGINTTGAILKINSGIVKATGGANAAGIGGRGGTGATGLNTRGDSGGTIDITGGTVIATGGGTGGGNGGGGAGIGGGGGNGSAGSNTSGGSGGTINITGGTVIASGDGVSAGIGGGGIATSSYQTAGNGGNIKISGGTIITTARTDTNNNVAAAIGGGSNTNGMYGGNGTFEIDLANYRYWTNTATDDPGNNGTDFPPTPYVNNPNAPNPPIYKYVKIAGLPSAPLNFTTTPGDSQVALSWNAPASTGGLDHVIEKYEVSSDGGAWETATSNTGHTFDGLNNGTTYTFQVRAVNTNGFGLAATKTATPVAPIIVNAETPTITTQPTGSTYDSNETATALSVTATVTDGGTLSYQWYSNTANNTTGGTAVGTNSSTYTPLTTTVGTLYYYVVVTNTNTDVNGTQTATATSSIVAVTVSPKPITHAVTVESAGIGATGGGDYEEGATVSINAGTPPTGQQFLNWTTASPEVAFDNVNNATTTFTMPANNVTVTANFILSTIETDEKETKNVFDESEVEEVIGAIDTDLGFDNSDFVYDETSGKIFINEEIVKEIIAKLLTEEYTDFVSLGVISADVAEGNIAQVRIPDIEGAAFGVSFPKDIKLLKIISVDHGVQRYHGELLEYAGTYDKFDDGTFTLLENDGNISKPDDIAGAIESNGSYDLVVFIKDGGDYDLDGDPNGTVIDPLVIVNAESSVNPPNPGQPNPNPSPNPSQPTPGNGGMGGGGGCDSSAGMFGTLALLSVLSGVGLSARRRKKNG